MTPRLRRWGPLALLLLYVGLYYGLTAWQQAGLFERDGYFHARFAWMLPERGLSRAFPWTQLSTWRGQFCDKEFLFHLAMAPFARLGSDPILGARIFGALLAGAVMGAFYLMLRAQRVRHPLACAFLPLAMGGLFLARLGMLRSHVLSMLLLTLGLHLMLEKRYRAVFVLGFVYAWSYTVPFVLFMTAVPIALGRWLGREAFDWRLLLAAGGGSAAGLVLHPYTPLTLATFLTYVQVFRLGLQGAGTSGFELGNELYPYPWAVLLDIYPLLILLAALLLVVLVLARRRLTPATLGLGLAALAWFGMTARTPRFAEYSVLLVAAACALVLRDLLPLLEVRRWWASRRWLRLGTGALALALLAGFHARAVSFDRVYQSAYAPPRFFTGACAWMAQHLAPGETVINLFWDDFPDLYYDGYRQTFLWGLDPTYSLREDPDRARLLEHYRRHAAPLDAKTLTQAFHTRWLVLRTARAKGFPELELRPFRVAYQDASALVVTWD
ncbi:hypothetical protein [Geothrix edaphica]|uniref:Glycosyltransferase RgtA/B/C/D-like domain-containing protein n=1 Tax=Geothrix edaphica TaxID=2927976 RepID=A0ABQ5PZP0_9BACT|nr:hypothetical protein [Geothrix edaphica]GLH67550.1 hypothetical protein GETHED_19140 [Geothrix edaphica]